MINKLKLIKRNYDDVIFKAKRKDNGEWVEGYYSKSPDPIFAFLKDYIFAPYYDYDKERGYDNGYQINPDTLCQYTGKKDCKKKKIWENDIVEEGCNGLIGIVVWDNDLGTYRLQNLDGEYGEDYIIKDAHIEWEVIGNVFDNPELLDN